MGMPKRDAQGRFVAGSGSKGKKGKRIKDTFSQMLKQIEKQVPNEVREAMEMVARKAEEQAKLNIPVEKGTARQSITVKEKLRKNVYIYYLGTNVTSKDGYPYPVVLEFGSKWVTVGTPRSPLKSWPAKQERGGGWDIMPWLRPAIRSVQRLMEKSLAKAIGKSAGRFKVRERRG